MTNIPAGNSYDKYGTRNPIARYLMGGFLEAFDELSGKTAANTVFEAGCGEGHLSLRLARRGYRVRGSDLSTEIVNTAQSNARREGLDAPFTARSIYDLDESDSADLVVCCEVLEHLDKPDAALRVLTRIARPWLLVSVPREPLWRALNILRGSYLTDWGNTPGHLQHWSTPSFLSFLSGAIDVVEVRRPFPWTMALCRTRG